MQHEPNELDLSDRGLTDELLSSLLKITPNITKLDLTSNPKLTSLLSVSHLHQLETLIISETSIVDLSPLKGLVNIRHFDAEETKVTDISPLKNSTNLRTLILTSTKVDNRVFDVLPFFLELTDLSLSNTHVSGDVSKLKSCTKLKTLTLIDIDISPRSLLELKTLHDLSFINVDPECESAKNELTQSLSGLQKRQKAGELATKLYVAENALNDLSTQQYDATQLQEISDAVKRMKVSLTRIEEVLANPQHQTQQLIRSK